MSLGNDPARGPTAMLRIRRRSPVAGCVLSLMLVTVSACATGTGQRVVPVQAATASVKSSETTLGNAAATSRPGPQPAVRPAAEPPSTIDPARIVGLDRATLERLLGEPLLVRREAPAEVWQYRGADCVLDLFLYEEAGGPRVLYIEARTEAAEPAPAERCIGSIAAARREPRAS